jgi:hypothetical protein
MTEVVANELVLLGGPGGGSGSGGGGFQKRGANNDFDQRAPEHEATPVGDTGITDEDIPF